MGFLARLTGEPADGENLLGLPSRYHMPADVRRERDREVGKSMARTQVVATDIRGVQYAGTVAIAAMANVSDVAERAAMRTPEERARIDSVADTVAVALNQKITELAGGLGQ